MACTGFRSARLAKKPSRSSRLKRELMRSWGALVATSGLFLVYAGFNPDVRQAALVVVGAGKLAFVLLLLTQAGRPLKGQALVAVVVDGLMVLIFAAYLFATQPGVAG